MSVNYEVHDIPTGNIPYVIWKKIQNIYIITYLFPCQLFFPQILVNNVFAIDVEINIFCFSPLSRISF